MGRMDDIAAAKARARVQPAVPRKAPPDLGRRGMALQFGWAVKELPAYLLIDILRQLPLDATIHDFGRHPDTFESVIIFISAEWPPVPRGERAPEITMELTAEDGVPVGARLIFPEPRRQS